MVDGIRGAWEGHPSIPILVWLPLAVALQLMHPHVMLATGAMLLIGAIWKSGGCVYRLLRRTRWIMFSLLLVYGYATPGEALWTEAGSMSPTSQGLLDGLYQMSRLVAMLAALSVMLNLLSIRQLINGLYKLAYPLHLIGMPRERMVVRLALTLHYAGLHESQQMSSLRDAIDKELDGAPERIELHDALLRIKDVMTLVVCWSVIALLLMP